MSARSFHEDRLLGARDEAIHSLRRQLDVVTDGNGALQEQVDAAEQEIARLQEVMQQRDVASHALKVWPALARTAAGGCSQALRRRRGAR